MSRYRIIRDDGRYCIEKAGWFFWQPLREYSGHTNPETGPIFFVRWFDSAHAAMDAAREQERQPPRPLREEVWRGWLE